MHNMQNRFLHINMINFILSMVFCGAMLDRFYIIYVRAFETLPSTMIFNYTHSGSMNGAIRMQPAGDRWVSSDCEMANNCTAGLQKSNSCGTTRDKGSSADFDRWPDREQSVSICRLAHLALLERSTWILDQCSSEQVLIEVFAQKNWLPSADKRWPDGFGNKPHFEMLNPFRLCQLWNLADSSINFAAMFTIWPGNWNERNIRRRRRLRVSHES